MTTGKEAEFSPSNTPTGQELCPQAQALIPACALGATDPDDTLVVQAGLARCPEAADALAEYTALVEEMLHSVAPVAPPEHLAGRLLAALNAPSAAANADSPRPATANRQTGGSRAWLWRSPASALVAAALCLLLLLLSNVFWANRYNQLQAQHASLQRQFQEQTTIIARLRAGHFQRMEMAAAAGGDPTSHAMVMYDPAATQALLYAEDFPLLPAGQVYQLWLIQGETRTNGGLFTVDADGFGVLVIDAPQPLRSYERMGITPEPEGGSPGPTAPPIVTGAF